MLYMKQQERYTGKGSLSVQIVAWTDFNLNLIQVSSLPTKGLNRQDLNIHVLLI